MNELPTHQTQHKNLVHYSTNPNPALIFLGCRGSGWFEQLSYLILGSSQLLG